MAQLKVRFILEKRRVMIRFPDKHKASAYTERNSDAWIGDKDHSRDVYLPCPAGLEYVKMQASQGNDALVFVFAKKNKAEDWVTRSVLGRRDGTEVHIKLRWEDRELDKVLGVAVKKDKVAGPKKPRPDLPDDDDDFADPTEPYLPPRGGRR
jgi:hypothetical protein